MLAALMANAFEEQSQPEEKILPEHPEIEEMRDRIAVLKALGLAKTAEGMQRRLDKRLREEEGTLEG